MPWAAERPLFAATSLPVDGCAIQVEERLAAEIVRAGRGALFFPIKDGAVRARRKGPDKITFRLLLSSN